MDDLLKNFLKGKNEDGKDRGGGMLDILEPFASSGATTELVTNPRYLALLRELVVYRVVAELREDDEFTIRAASIGLAYLVGRQDGRDEGE